MADDDDPVKDKDQDEHTKPGIPRPGRQSDQEQQPFAPAQPPQRPLNTSSQWLPPLTGNPDLDPAGVSAARGIDLRQPNPAIPQGMIYDPRQLIDQQRRGSGLEGGLPPGARFDPFGPPDPSHIGPGRGPLPSSQFGIPDPDELPPPGQANPPNLFSGRGKSLKSPWPPGGPGFPRRDGGGGGPFL